MESLVVTDAVSKTYGPRTVVDGVHLSVRAGEVHALVGENGAGKSTLANMIAGVVRPSSGSVRVDGRPLGGGGPRAARRAGVAFVSQELSLLGERTVVENVFTGQMPTRVPGIVSRSRMRTAFAALMQDTGLRLDPDRRVDGLNAVEQEFVEILRAVAAGAHLIILDEPTTATTPDQAELIYRLVGRLAERGVAIVLISHDLDDVLRVCDRISVLRDGRHVRTVARGEVTKQELITLMIGRELTDLYPRSEPGSATDVALSVRDLGRRNSYDGISFDVRRGEILGIAGLVGSGRSEVLMGIVGAEPPERGSVSLDGKPARIRTVRDAQRVGIALIPENRKTQGLHLDHSIESNITLPHLRWLSRLGVVGRRGSRAVAADGVQRTQVKCASVRAPVRTLSGGNQQRALFAKWLVETPHVLLVDEPTRGVDVQGKHAIYAILADLAAQGTAIVVVSSEVTEVIGLSHRVLVMHRGRIHAELEGPAITEEAVVSAAFGDEHLAEGTVTQP